MTEYERDKTAEALESGGLNRNQARMVANYLSITESRMKVWVLTWLALPGMMLGFAALIVALRR